MNKGGNALRINTKYIANKFKNVFATRISSIARIVFISRVYVSYYAFTYREALAIFPGHKNSSYNNLFYHRMVVFVYCSFLTDLFKTATNLILMVANTKTTHCYIKK